MASAFCEVLVLRVASGILPAMFFFTGSRFVHAAFCPKSESEKSCLGEQIFAKREKFFDHALRLVTDVLTLKSSF